MLTILNFYETDTSVGITPMAFFIGFIVAYGMLLLILYLKSDMKLPGAVKCAVVYGIVVCAANLLSGYYRLSAIPFKSIEMLFWVAILVLSYTAVRKYGIMNRVVILAAIFFPIGFFQYVISIQIYSGLGSRIFLANSVYQILFLLPIILLIKREWIKTLCIIAVFAAVVISYKRTALAAFFAGLISYYIFMSKVSMTKKRKVHTALLLIIGAVLSVILYTELFNLFGLNWQDRIYALSYDRGSARIDIWGVILNAIKNQDFASWIVGHGHRSTAIFGGAHNDFIEVLYDYGLAGFSLYILFWIKLVITFVRMLREKYRNTPAFAFSIMLFFVCSMTSQLIILMSWFIYLALFWGITIADFERSRALSGETIHAEA